MKTKRWLMAMLIAAALFTGISPVFAAQDTAVKSLDGTIWRCVSKIEDERKEIWQFDTEEIPKRAAPATQIVVFYWRSVSVRY
jgi:hypothetical protein